MEEQAGTSVVGERQHMVGPVRTLDGKDGTDVSPITDNVVDPSDTARIGLGTSGSGEPTTRTKPDGPQAADSAMAGLTVAVDPKTRPSEHAGSMGPAEESDTAPRWRQARSPTWAGRSTLLHWTRVGPLTRIMRREVILGFLVLRRRSLHQIWKQTSPGPRQSPMIRRRPPLS